MMMIITPDKGRTSISISDRPGTISELLATNTTHISNENTDTEINKVVLWLGVLN